AAPSARPRASTSPSRRRAPGSPTGARSTSARRRRASAGCRTRSPAPARRSRCGSSSRRMRTRACASVCPPARRSGTWSSGAPRWRPTPAARSTSATATARCSSAPPSGDDLRPGGRPPTTPARRIRRFLRSAAARMRDGPDPVRLSAKGGAVRRLVLVVAVVPAVSLLGASAAALPARPHWAITDLAASTGWSGEAQLINERGRIAGVVYGTTTYQPFLWDRGRTTLLGTLRGTTNASPIAINERGDVIGFATTKRGAFRGFVWRTGGMIDLGTLGGRETSPSDENDRGDIVGWSKTRSGQMHAFLWRNGKMRDLGAGAASAVDEQGRVVGSTRYGTNTRAWLWENGTKTDLGSLGGADVHPSVLNERRVVAGLGTTASPADGWHAFLWENGR